MKKNDIILIQLLNKETTLIGDDKYNRFRGKVVQETKHHVTVNKLNHGKLTYNETFLKSDFRIVEA